MRSIEQTAKTSRSLQSRPLADPEFVAEALNAKKTAELLAIAVDVALVIDSDGIIRDISLGRTLMGVEGLTDCVGQSWKSNVAVDSQPKIEKLLNTARECEPFSRAVWRQINHSTTKAANLPILYSAISLEQDGTVLALGRDLRTISDLQQRLLEVERSLQSEYDALRRVETRYRMLFQIASDAIFLIHSGSRRIAEANPSTYRLLQLRPEDCVGKRFPIGLNPASTEEVTNLLTTVSGTGRPATAQVQAASDQRELSLSASFFRQEDASFFLVRLSAIGQSSTDGLAQPSVMELLENSPDGFVVTDPNGKILMVNRAFLDFLQIPVANQAVGEDLERWLGRAGIDFMVILRNLRSQGSVRAFNTAIRGEYGATAEVELSAVAALDAEPPCLGFTIRDLRSRPVPSISTTGNLPQSVEQLTELVGRVPLKDLVKETTDIIERLCIEAALEMTDDNRVSAAEVLGLSRQSLYVKLRRYGLLDSAQEDE